MPYLAAYLGGRLLNSARFLTRPGDVSYGVYVYAFPAEQTAVHLLGTSSVPLIIGATGRRSDVRARMAVLALP